MAKEYFPWATRSIPQIFKAREYKGKLKGFTVDEFSRLYIEEKKSIRAIAMAIGCSLSNLASWIRFHKGNLNLRDRFEASAIRYDRELGNGERLVNQRFFSRWSRPMAYVLGWFYTDGCIVADSRTNRINSACLSLADIEHVGKIAALLEFKGKISVRSNDRLGSEGRLLATIRVNRKGMIDDLLRLGMVPRKSLILRFPVVPAKYLPDFIRGCWEGDGSYQLEGKYGVKASFVSGSLEFIRAMELHLRSLGLDETPIVPEQYGRKNISYCLRYFGENVEKLFNLLYVNSLDTMRLDRKYEVIKNGVSRWRARRLQRLNNEFHGNQ